MPYVGRTPTPSPVTIDDIPANSIDASKIVDGSIEVSDIKDNSITDAKLNSTKLDGIADSANNYSHPAAHTVSEVTGLQGLLDGKTTETYVNTQVAALVASSPATLDTLNELATALGNDPNFATTTANSIGTKLPLSGGTMTGDTLHGDNVKAMFGAGNDLQIYHDGGNTYIKENGTGDLRIKASNLSLQDSSGYDYIACSDLGNAGEVEIKYAGLTKLATTSTGIDVTGTVTADGLTVDYISADAATLSIGNTGTHDAFINSPEALYINIDSDNSQTNTRFRVGKDATNTSGGKLFNVEENGDISFYEDTGTTAKFFWDASAESLGIGTSSPAAKLDVNGTLACGGIVTIDGGTGYGNLEIGGNSGAHIDLKAPNSDDFDARLLTTGNGLSISTNTGVGSVRLQHETATKLATTSTGVSVTGTLNVSDLSYTGNINGGYAAGNFHLDTQSQTNKGIYLNWFGGNAGTFCGNGASGFGPINASAFNQVSDYRLKENIVPMAGSIARLKSLKPCNFNFIAGNPLSSSWGTSTVDGFIAHEVQEVVPECATGTKDGMKDEEYEVTPAVKEVLDDEGNVTTEAVEAVMSTRSVPDYQGIDQSKLVPLLVASLQEAIARIEVLENA